MSKVDFDQFSDNYSQIFKSSPGLLGKNEEFFASVKFYCLKKWVVNSNSEYNILDFGCGIGKLTGLLAKGLPLSNIYGYDFSPKSLSVAKENNSELRNVSFIHELAQEQRYDFIIAANVFHHIEVDERVNTLHKLKCLLKPGCKIVIFEHNPFNPMTWYVVRSCPFDSDAILISPRKFASLAKSSGLKVTGRFYILFFPWPLEFFRKIEGALRNIPAGAQYMLLLV